MKIYHTRPINNSQLAVHNSQLPFTSLGGVLTSTLTAELEAALASQSALPDPATGLVHLGGGRWYDPSVGRPLQPDPAGGPPTVPQALNRYAVPVGGMGVAEGTASGINFASPSAWIGLATNIGLEIAGRKTVVQSGRLVVEGPLEIVQKAFEVGAGKSIIGGYSIIPAIERTGVVRLRTRGFTGVIEEFAEGEGFVFRKFNRTISTEGLEVVRYQPGSLLRDAKGLSVALSLGVTFLVDVGAEGYGFMTETGRWGNPYLSRGQKFGQAGLVMGGDLLFTGSLLLFTTNPYIVIPAVFIWAISTESLIYENVFPGLYGENRNLKPLQVN